MRIFLLAIFFITTFLFSAETVSAASLTYVKDLIFTSNPNATSTHTVEFTATNAVPVSGKIVITPEGGYFNIPVAFDYTDVDFSVASSGPFMDRQLAASADALNDGVSVVSGLSGSITINLNSSGGLNAGDRVRLEFGSNADFGEIGDQNIVNPSSAGSFKIRIQTKNSSDAPIDSAAAMIAIIEPVSVSANVLSQAPIRSNGLPAGEIPAGSDMVEISLNTNKEATCRYDTVSGTDYDSMTNTFSSTGSSTVHMVTLSGLLDNTSYTFYVRCKDSGNFTNDDDFIISFSLKATPPPPSTGGESEAVSRRGGGSGAIIGGSERLYLSSVLLEGWAYPITNLNILKDGEIISGVMSGQDGFFKKEISGLERGTYTFSIYAQDGDKRKSSIFSSTLSLRQGTNNKISDIVIAPSIELKNDTLKVGDKAVVFGESVPGSTVELFVDKQQKNKNTIGEGSKFTASSTKGVKGFRDGSWKISFDTSSFENGTYEVKARSILNGQAESSFSRIVWLGMGGEPKPDFSLRADLNKDGKVNLIDFSILLVHWGGSDQNTDINLDGTVNLSDFSIMLFNWTG